MLKEPEVILEKLGSLGIIKLNRPKKLNTITKTVVQLVKKYLKDLENDNNILAVLFEGSGEKAFCAGGDLLSILDIYKKEGTNSATDVFAGGYANCLKIKKFKKPIISFMDGIIMGGGAGLSRVSDIRIVTENSKWAMPETKIGLFPDVGIGYYLTRMKASIGVYLGITGKIIDGDDCLFSKIATVKILKKNYNNLKKELIIFLSKKEIKELSKENLIIELRRISEKFSSSPKVSFLEKNKIEIEKYFSKNSVDEIIDLLKKDSKKSEFAKITLNDIKGNSPLSMKIAFEEMKRMKNLSLDIGYKLDLSLVEELFKSKNLFEGIRAVVIDKTKDAVWEEGTLLEVSDDMVNNYFKPFEQLILKSN